MTTETKWTPKRGDTVWAARMGWSDTWVEAESAIVRAVSAKRITLSGSGMAFGFASRFDPSWLGKRLHPTKEAALLALVQTQTEAVREAQRLLTLAQAAYAKSLGDQP